jgi:hypothetical protein
MSDETISALLAKRTELAEQVQHIQATIFHLDAALEAFGYRPGGSKPKRRFANGELIRLIGEAERAGVTTLNGIARWVVQAKGWNAADQTLYKRTLWSVKECRKRMNAKGV